METVVGIYTTRAEAVRTANRLQEIGINPDQINLLSPAEGADGIEQVPTSDTEQKGMGTALGGVVGGAIGAAGGMSLGAAAASLFVPGVGPILAAGILAGTILGAGGAVGGAAAGKALEEATSDGLPRDELFVYEDALRRGRTVLMVLAENDEEASQARQLVSDTCAESIDAARENWWVGLRSAEEAAYTSEGRDFASAEQAYRCGFEAAQHPDVRRQPYDKASTDLQRRYPKLYTDETFRHGYERGQDYYRGWEEKFKE